MNVTAAQRDALTDFIYGEALLLDEKRFDEWYELFSEDGIYWIPLIPGQTDALDYASLMYEDRLQLKLRIDRLKQARAFSQQPESRCLHVLQCPSLRTNENGGYQLRTPMIYTETRSDEHLVYAATVFHDVIDFEGTFKIRSKRINLLNCDAPLPAIQLFM